MANEYKLTCPYDAETIEVSDPTVLPAGWNADTYPNLGSFFSHINGKQSWAHTPGDHPRKSSLFYKFSDQVPVEQGSGWPESLPPP